MATGDQYSEMGTHLKRQKTAEYMPKSTKIGSSKSREESGGNPEDDSDLEIEPVQSS